MEKKFDGKVALVTGAAVGIGRATALLFAEGSAKTVIIDLNYEKLNKVKEEIESLGGEVLAYECDVSDEEKVYEVVKDAEERFGKIDILVNNAALWKTFSKFNETSTDVWRKFLDVNVMGTVYFTKAVIDGMINRGFGRIINVASVAGVYGNGNMSFYSASKGAVISFTKALAKEVITNGVTVNSVSPGSVSSSAIDDIDHTAPSDLAHIGRTGSDRENAELILFLASDGASYISGENVIIDGCRKKL
ncbi:MAG: SDR family oxidoreductase [Clostridia bacterium]|nr:SDR family oxidoreductase [Clostridia bacterium]